MGVARSIEQRLEGMVEGFFTKVFRSGLQPIEVGRRILREMADGKTLSVNRVYTPNEFTVRMGPEDFKRFSGMEAGLQKEFSELVIQSAKENRWNLMGLPEIEFTEDKRMGRGEFRIEASFAAAPEEQPRISTREPSRDDPGATRAVPSDTAERMGIVGAHPQLLVLDVSGEPTERISVTRDPIVIGRLSNSDVVLSDPNVSRRHAELRRDGDRWSVVDLGSTNGTLVNGKLAGEHPLRDGDRLTIGTSELQFKLPDGD